MRTLKTIVAFCLLIATTVTTHAQKFTPAHFNKVIVSPYIQVTFVQGDKEGVTINDMIVDSSKLNVEVNNGTLRIYLDGAKDIPHNQHANNGDGSKQSYPLYPNHAVTATVTYVTLNELSLRGEETQLCQSPLNTSQFNLYVYGTSRVIFTEAHIDELHTTLYGESTLEIKSGRVNKQYYTCYGEGKIKATAITGQQSKITAYGEAEFWLNVTDRIKITAFGEAKLRYIGTPNIVKGLHFGKLDVQGINAEEVELKKI